MSRNGMRPAHPGEVIREEFMAPLGLSANALAMSLNVPTPRINVVVRGRRGVSADTAMRLARYFGGDAAKTASKGPAAVAGPDAGLGWLMMAW